MEHVTYVHLNNVTSSHKRQRTEKTRVESEPEPTTFVLSLGPPAHEDTLKEVTWQTADEQKHPCIARLVSGKKNLFEEESGEAKKGR